jgi:hypothetical protein
MTTQALQHNCRLKHTAARPSVGRSVGGSEDEVSQGKQGTRLAPLELLRPRDFHNEVAAADEGLQVVLGEDLSRSPRVELHSRGVHVLRARRGKKRKKIGNREKTQ